MQILAGTLDERVILEPPFGAAGIYAVALEWLDGDVIQHWRRANTIDLARSGLIEVLTPILEAAHGS